MLTTKRVRFRILYLLYIQVKYFGEQFVKGIIIKGITKKTMHSEQLCTYLHYGMQ